MGRRRERDSCGARETARERFFKEKNVKQLKNKQKNLPQTLTDPTVSAAADEIFFQNVKRARRLQRFRRPRKSAKQRDASR